MMARKQILQTTLFFLMAYAVTPWVCNLVVQHLDEETFEQTAMEPNANTPIAAHQTTVKRLGTHHTQ